MYPITQECKTLTECLNIDQEALARHVFPDLPSEIFDKIHHASKLGILKKMQAIGSILYQQYELQAALSLCHNHSSDIVRGWTCFIIGAASNLTVEERLSYILPLADDTHFGVREWAWLALRSHLINHLEQSFALLAPLTQSPSELIRRFSCEILRPRGVWCPHIPALKQDPSPGLIILNPLKSDPSIYVQDSVSNWLNDACKTQPEWVQMICQQWLSESPSIATQRICKRALRSLKSQ
ncbi:DNA alkylation repair protein [Commensalibacter nepenthis]|uniref:DNA alkylation repair protein n=1 Tax=Commensalibacter nepenthis TaxID=3043872 RepID=A0ABT6Q9U0_9PROT|nr:DNA alkylation repair protein [Commensalibacter sp. TBRC 10068]MDI2113527.1 DNA alkylation repair protein [Commensalibacter sp. TBRC 10068]